MNPARIIGSTSAQIFWMNAWIPDFRDGTGPEGTRIWVQVQRDDWRFTPSW